MPHNEHGHEVDEDWTPGNPVLEGRTQSPDQAPGPERNYLLDELPHRERWKHGLTDEQPDPGYHPCDDDLEVRL